MKFKYASLKDLNTCIRLSKTSWPRWWAQNEKCGKKHIKERIKEKRVFIVISNREIIAYLVYGILWNKIHVEDVFVKKEYRRHRIGSTLLKHIFEFAKKQGFRELISDCDVSNKVSIKYHLKNGFKKCGYIKNNWGKEDSYTFSKKI